jgi:ADP-ribosylglycohydrolase
MALCLAASFAETGRFDPADQMERYSRWRRRGYMSSNGVCFDIGGTVAAALSRYEATGEAVAGSTDEGSAGNGSIMRLAPVPMFYHRLPADAIERAGESSRTTHGTPMAVDSCRYMAGVLVGAIGGAAKEELVSSMYAPVPGYWNEHELDSRVAEVAAGSFARKSPPEIRGTGFVIRTLEAALWAFATTESFEAAALRAVNLGDDADTTGAVCGQIAGAFYGASAIPSSWLEKLARLTEIEELIERLYARAPVA